MKKQTLHRCVSETEPTIIALEAEEQGLLRFPGSDRRCNDGLVVL